MTGGEGRRGEERTDSLSGDLDRQTPLRHGVDEDDELRDDLDDVVAAQQEVTLLGQHVAVVRLGDPIGTTCNNTLVQNIGK